MCSCVGLGLGLGLGIGFREWVPIRNIIDGAAGAHIPMTFGLPLSACIWDTACRLHKLVVVQSCCLILHLPIQVLD